MRPGRESSLLLAVIREHHVLEVKMTLEEMRRKIEEEDAEKEKTIAAKVQNAIERFEGFVKEWLGDAYEEFEWKYDFDGRGRSQACATVNRGGLTKLVSASPLSFHGGRIALDDTRALVRWAQEADALSQERFDERKKGLKNALERLTAGEVIGHYVIRDIEAHAKKHGYADDPAYAKAKAAYWAMCQVKDRRHKQKEKEEADRWFALMRNESSDVSTWDQLGDWRHKFGPNVPVGELNEVGDKIRAVLELADAEKEDRAHQAGLEAFHPFVYYKIKYALVATDKGGNACCDLRLFHSLQLEPDDAGFYLDIWGERRRPANVFEVVEMVVSEHSQLPQWCPQVKATEARDSYRVPPPDAKHVTKQGDAIPF